MDDPASAALNLPPGPKGQALKHFRARLTDYPGLMEELHRKYGKIAYLSMPGMNFCAVFDADMALEMYEREPPFVPHYPGGSAYELLDMCLPTAQGEDHARRRELMLSAATEERMGHYAGHAIRAAIALRERRRPGRTVDRKAEFDTFSWRTLLDSVFGSDLQVDPDVGRAALQSMKLDIFLGIVPLRSLIVRLPLSFNRRVRNAMSALDEPIYEAIRKARRADRPGNDALSHLVRAADRGIVDWSWENDKAIRDEVVALLCAFPDAPVAAYTCGAHHLGTRPEVRERVEQEVDDVLGTRDIEVDDFERLPYLRAFFLETLRVTTPAYVVLAKVAVEDCELGGYTIPEGTVVSVGAQQIHTDGDYWLETPFEKCRIAVDDAPFTAVEMSTEGAGKNRRIVFRTNIDETVTADASHPIRVQTDMESGAPAPYVCVRDGLDALIVRSVFYDLVELGEEAEGPDGTVIGVWSGGVFFPLGNVGE